MLWDAPELYNTLIEYFIDSTYDVITNILRDIVNQIPNIQYNKISIRRSSDLKNTKEWSISCHLQLIHFKYVECLSVLFYMFDKGIINKEQFIDKILYFIKNDSANQFSANQLYVYVEKYGGNTGAIYQNKEIVTYMKHNLSTQYMDRLLALESNFNTLSADE